MSGCREQQIPLFCFAPIDLARIFRCRSGIEKGAPHCFSALIALALELAHGGLDELLGAVDLVENSLEIERGLGRVAIRDAIDAVLSDEDEGIGEYIERDSEAASLQSEHKLVLL
jgi:hypothetical protein